MTVWRKFLLFIPCTKRAMQMKDGETFVGCLNLCLKGMKHTSIQGFM